MEESTEVRKQKDWVNIILAADELDTSGCRSPKLRFFYKSSISVTFAIVRKHYVINTLLSRRETHLNSCCILGRINIDNVPLFFVWISRLF